MPNHCENTITVLVKKRSKTTQAVQEDLLAVQEMFEDVNRRGTGLCNHLLPLPEELVGIHSGTWTIGGVSHDRWRDGFDPKTGEKIFIPVGPRERRRLQKKYGADNWYDWQIKNWGIKWDVYDVKLAFHVFCSNVKGYVRHAPLRLWFQTAWCPTVPAIEQLSRRYPRLHFMHTWCEQGSLLVGRVIYENGVIIAEYDKDLAGKRFYTDGENLTKKMQTFLDENDIGLGG
jgi:hypothetical protein